MRMAMENGKCPMIINCSRWCTHLLDIVPHLTEGDYLPQELSRKKNTQENCWVKKSEKIRKTSKSDRAKRVKKDMREKTNLCKSCEFLEIYDWLLGFWIGSVRFQFGQFRLTPIRRNRRTDCPTRETQTAPRSWVYFAIQEIRTPHLMEEFWKLNYWHILLACNDEIQLTLRFAQFSWIVNTSSQRQDTWPPTPTHPVALRP